MRAAAIVVGCALAVACATRLGETMQSSLPAHRPEEARGEQVFMARCHKCHPDGEAGLGPGINGKPLPGFLMHLQIRQGLGAMPAFGDDLISDAELDDLLAYLATR